MLPDGVCTVASAQGSGPRFQNSHIMNSDGSFCAKWFLLRGSHITFLLHLAEQLYVPCMMRLPRCVQVAFAWADGLGAARGHRKLAQLDLLDRAVAHGVNSGRFESARELAEAAGQVHLAAWAHHQHALSLQEQGDQPYMSASWLACAIGAVASLTAP